MKPCNEHDDFFVMDQIERGNTEIKKLPIEEMMVDFLAKLLRWKMFKEFYRKILAM